MQFSPAVDATAYDDWLASLPADEAVSVYVHIPFCRRLCWYCGCNTRVVNGDGPVSRYVRIGLDHFALRGDGLAVAASDGKVMRNFQGYGVSGPQNLIGFGASAISQLRQGMAQNQTAELAWGQALDRGVLPTARGVALTPEDRLRGEVIERLVCAFSVDLSEVTAAHHFPGDALDAAAPTLAQLERDGLIVRSGSVVNVTALGRPYVRAVCAAFDAYLEPEARRHALAV